MKDLYSGNLYWPVTLPNPARFPALQSDKRHQAVVVGGGISGAICSCELALGGIDACLVERGEIAGGSTSANTGLLQFCNDVMLSELIGQIGEHAAVRFYKGCLDAVGRIGKLASRLDADAGFVPRSSLYYASTDQHLPKLRREYEALRGNGFDVEYKSADEIAAQYPFRKPGAILTRGDGEINPYRFVHAMVEAAAKAGLDVYEHTDIVAHETDDSGLHTIRTASGAAVTAEHVVYAVGYEPEELRSKLIKAAINRTYAIATEPVPDLSVWPGRCLIWETARPYFYMRTTPDGRILAGGLDEQISRPLQGESARRERSQKLLAEVRRHFPSLDAKLACDWTASFGESRDRLPFIGEDPERRRVYYCLGYGGNGTVYSAMASGILLGLIRREGHPLADIVRLDRPSLQKA